MNDMDNIDKILGVKVKGQVLPGGIIRCPETCQKWNWTDVIITGNSLINNRSQTALA